MNGIFRTNAIQRAKGTRFQAEGLIWALKMPLSPKRLLHFVHFIIGIAPTQEIVTHRIHPCSHESTRSNSRNPGSTSGSVRESVHWHPYLDPSKYACEPTPGPLWEFTLGPTCGPSRGFTLGPTTEPAFGFTLDLTLYLPLDSPLNPPLDLSVNLLWV